MNGVSRTWDKSVGVSSDYSASSNTATGHSRAEKL